MRFITLLFAAFLATSASAAEPAPVSLSWTPVAIDSSKPGETMDQFALRVAPFLDAYTAENEVEACGRISVKPDGIFWVELGTIGASMVCALPVQKIQPGSTDTGVSIHSHPNPRKLRPTAVDVMLARAGRASPAMFKSVVKNNGRNGFSTDDFAAGPGYVVAGGKVLFQEGPKTVREVGALENPASYRSFDPR